MSRHHHHHQATFTTEPTAPNTTFVQADPSNFRTIVQKLTGAVSDDISSSSATQKLPLNPLKHTYRLHERRQTTKKLEIMLNNSNRVNNGNRQQQYHHEQQQQRERGFLVSPVSHLELWTRVSPRSPQEEEEKAIAEKGFYLHKSPLNTPRGGGGGHEPELLPLFPLHSPTTDINSHDQ